MLDINRPGFINRSMYNWSPPIPTEKTRVYMRKKLEDPRGKRGEPLYNLYVLYNVPSSEHRDYRRKLISRLKSLGIEAISDKRPRGAGYALSIKHTIGRISTLNKLIRIIKSAGIKETYVRISSFL